jgi:hypothetical protein
LACQATEEGEPLIAEVIALIGLLGLAWLLEKDKVGR